MSKSNWVTKDRFAELTTPWFTLIGEHIQTDNEILDYWRVEKVDSVIVLPIQEDRILLPPTSYRPGVSTETLDFPGGRCPDSQRREEAAWHILERELGIEINTIASLQPLNSQGWLVNSSFSNQKVYGFIAHLHAGSVPNLGSVYSADPPGVKTLLRNLSCLQCRMVLLEWWHLQQG